MARFNFSMQKLLDIKKYIEDQKAIHLSTAQTRLYNEMIALKSIDLRKEDFFGADNKSDGLDIIQVRSAHAYLLQLNTEIAKQKKAIESAQAEVDKRKKVLLKAHQDKKSIELLKEKHRDVFKKVENQKSIKTENEIALRRSKQEAF